MRGEKLNISIQIRYKEFWVQITAVINSYIVNTEKYFTMSA